MLPPSDTPSVMGVRTQVHSGHLDEQGAYSVSPAGIVRRKTTMELGRYFFSFYVLKNLHKITRANLRFQRDDCIYSAPFSDMKQKLPLDSALCGIRQQPGASGSAGGRCAAHTPTGPLSAKTTEAGHVLRR